MAEPKKYQLSTIKDIFEKVPSDRIEICLKELVVSLLNAKAIKASFDAIGQGFEYPEVITWVDDDKGEIVSNIRDKGTGNIMAIIKGTMK